LGEKTTPHEYAGTNLKNAIHLIQEQVVLWVPLCRLQKQQFAKSELRDFTNI